MLIEKLTTESLNNGSIYSVVYQYTLNIQDITNAEISERHSVNDSGTKVRTQIIVHVISSNPVYMFIVFHQIRLVDVVYKQTLHVLLKLQRLLQ